MMSRKINIVRNLISAALLAVLCSCGGQNVQDRPSAATNEQNVAAKDQNTRPTAKVKQPIKPRQVRITDENVVDELTKYGQQNPETLVRITTPMGSMLIELYTNTPLHRANFVRLVKGNYYNGTEFYRVINNFMIQGGDTDGFDRSSIKDKYGKWTVPAEFRPDNIHKRGAVSMVREYENNPEKRSEAFEFFIVQGTRYTDGELNGTEFNYNVKISPEHREIYKTAGGCAYLDGEHTVFGEVIEGLDVIDKIASVKTDNGDWPIDAVTIKMEIVDKR